MTDRSSPLRRKLPLGALIFALGCGGGASFDGRVYQSEEVSFRIGPVPPTWRPIDVEEALLAYRDDSKNATVAIGARCGRDGDDVPLQALTHHLFLQFTDRQIVKQEIMPMDGREAMRTELVAELDGVPKRYTVYVMKKDGCVYDFLHIADTGAPSETRAEFERFVRGFATL